MYYIVSESTFLPPMMGTTQLVAQCAWCTVILEGEHKGEVIGYLDEHASHGCCFSCRQKIYASRKSRQLARTG